MNNSVDKPTCPRINGRSWLCCPRINGRDFTHKRSRSYIDPVVPSIKDPCIEARPAVDNLRLPTARQRPPSPRPSGAAPEGAV
jgi:hypothetical protein